MHGSLLESALQRTKDLVAFPSVSHESNEAVSQYVCDRLSSMGFDIEWLTYQDERNQRKVCVVARRGQGVGGVCYLAHTDVVPADDWSLDWCGPFEPTLKDDRLYGRGTCDMKGSLAAALVAAEQLDRDRQLQPMYFIVTADEEVGMLGAKIVNSDSKYFAEMVAHDTVGIVGEPTLLNVIHAHKGGQRLAVKAHGRSAHTSTNDGINANYQLIPALPELLAIRALSELDSRFRNPMFDPPTLSWNMTIKNEPEAMNVTPSLAQANIFLRLMPNVDHSPLIEQIQQVCDRYGLEFDVTEAVHPWQVSSTAVWVKDMLRLVQQDCSHSVCFATDAGVLQRLEKMLVCGPGDIAQAHRSDEWIGLDQLAKGVDIYLQAFQAWTK
jgi:acetylornithine deacetylase